MCVCMYMCVYVYVCIYIYIYVYLYITAWYCICSMLCETHCQGTCSNKCSKNRTGDSAESFNPGFNFNWHLSNYDKIQMLGLSDCFIPGERGFMLNNCSTEFALLCTDMYGSQSMTPSDLCNHLTFPPVPQRFRCKFSFKYRDQSTHGVICLL